MPKWFLSLNCNQKIPVLYSRCRKKSKRRSGVKSANTSKAVVMFSKIQKNAFDIPLCGITFLINASLINPFLCESTFMQSERRKNHRYAIQGKAFALVGSESTEMLPIIDVGIGGLGVCADDAWKIKSGHLEILMADCSFYLDRIPFKNILRFPAVCSNPFHSTPNYRCGLEFGKLMPSQIFKLRHFIRNYTRRGAISSIMGKFYHQVQHLLSKRHTAHACENIWHNHQHPSL